ncbi:hypothetical protein D7V94_18770 [Parablautia intestinalis]|uniref:Uncharacterized protein n=1 Tax=Parablautia intestinalis TaxID=2320100 RepID=A0A3A9AB83_9FIRM|nr:hypothetical protein D7V94_18770 [Parablautia intestinalis]
MKIFYGVKGRRLRKSKLSLEESQSDSSESATVWQAKLAICRRYKVERNFQPYVFGPVPTWEKPKRERHGYKNEIK